MKYLLTAILLLVCSNAFCCSCVTIGESTVKTALVYTDVVFVGKVLTTRTIDCQDEEFINMINESKFDSISKAKIIKGFKGKMTEYAFLINKIYKGKLKQDTINIVTPYIKDDACGYIFNLEEEYIVYCRYENKPFSDPSLKGNTKHLETSSCSRTRPATDTKEIEELEKLCSKKKRKRK